MESEEGSCDTCDVIHALKQAVMSRENSLDMRCSRRQLCIDDISLRNNRRRAKLFGSEGESN